MRYMFPIRYTLGGYRMTTSPVLAPLGVLQLGKALVHREATVVVLEIVSLGIQPEKWEFHGDLNGFEWDLNGIQEDFQSDHWDFYGQDKK